MKKFLSWLLCAIILFSHCSSAFALDLFKDISKEQKERYDKFISGFIKQYEWVNGAKFNNDFTSSGNNVIFISTEIENPDYEYYDQILEETRRKISEDYHVEVKDIPLIPIFVFLNENNYSYSFFSFDSNKDQSISILNEDFNVQNLTDKLIPFLCLKDIFHELSVNDLDYKNAPEHKKKEYEKHLKNIKNYFKDSTGKEFDDVFYCSNDSTLIISKAILEPDCKFYFDSISKAKGIAQSVLGMGSNCLIPIIITNNNELHDYDESCVSDLAEAAYGCKYKYITCRKKCLEIYTIAHELVHAILDTQLRDESSSKLPNWLNEGLATQTDIDRYLESFSKLTLDDLLSDDSDSIYDENQDIRTGDSQTINEFYSLSYRLIQEWIKLNGGNAPISQMVEEINNKVDNGTFKPSDFKNFFMAHNGDKAIESLKSKIQFTKDVS